MAAKLKFSTDYSRFAALGDSDDSDCEEPASASKQASTGGEYSAFSGEADGRYFWGFTLFDSYKKNKK